jgi:hypothetical protein
MRSTLGTTSSLSQKWSLYPGQAEKIHLKIGSPLRHPDLWPNRWPMKHLPLGTLPETCWKPRAFRPPRASKRVPSRFKIMPRRQPTASDFLRSKETREAQPMTPFKVGRLISRPWRQWACGKVVSSTLIHRIPSWPSGWRTCFTSITCSKRRCLLQRVGEIWAACNSKNSPKPSRKGPRGCRGSLIRSSNSQRSHTIWASYRKRCSTDARWWGGRTSICSRLVNSLLRSINYR